LSRELREEGQQHQQQQQEYPVNQLIKEMEWKLRTNIDGKWRGIGKDMAMEMG